MQLLDWMKSSNRRWRRTVSTYSSSRPGPHQLPATLVPLPSVRQIRGIIRRSGYAISVTNVFLGLVWSPARAVLFVDHGSVLGRRSKEEECYAVRLGEEYEVRFDTMAGTSIIKCQRHGPTSGSEISCGVVWIEKRAVWNTSLWVMVSRQCRSCTSTSWRISILI